MDASDNFAYPMPVSLGAQLAANVPSRGTILVLLREMQAISEERWAGWFQQGLKMMTLWWPLDYASQQMILIRPYVLTKNQKMRWWVSRGRQRCWFICFHKCIETRIKRYSVQPVMRPYTKTCSHERHATFNIKQHLNVCCGPCSHSHES